ncbi:MAG: hypothetical protein Q7S83_02195 [bacterium]|nr:hypothetical protein [bacterium]
MAVNTCFTLYDRPRIGIAADEVQHQLMTGWGRLKQKIVEQIDDLLKVGGRLKSKLVFSSFQTGHGANLQLEIGVWILKPDSTRTPSGACTVRVRNTSSGEWAYRMNRGPEVKPVIIAITVAGRLRML